MSRLADAEREMNAMAKKKDNEATKDVKLDQASNDKVSKLWAEVKEKKEAERKKAADLAALPVDAEDVQLLADSLSMTNDEAKLTLQRKKGDAIAALREAVGLPSASKTG